ncbi:MAG: hypothetical protein ACR2HX_06735 [Pyrinomonadaceae bacterium]
MILETPAAIMSPLGHSKRFIKREEETDMSTDEILANQRTIVANQQRIEANQAKLDEALND